MTVRQDIGGVVNNDLLYTIALTYNDRPLNLTAYAPTVVVKTSQAAQDSAGATYTVGAGLTVVSAPAGRFTLRVPRAATATAGSQWYRVDVTNGTDVSTALCGTLTLMSA